MPDVVRVEDPVLAVERERGRLADQLHSGVMQSLVVIRHSLARGAVGEPDAKPGLPTADEAVAQCLAETRNLVWHLRPRTLDAPLPHALEELAHRLSSDGGACLVVDTDAVITISDVHAALVYRVVQSVATLTSGGAALAVRVSADDAQAAVTLIGASAGVADDAEVAEWFARASAYGVAVELVSS
ncbi:MAG TPA: histidine kinase [Mycobacteriales bacterium]|nr:histidine kinase [Mycobacteriales bacterium]